MRIIAALMASVFFLTACETIQGAGRDIEDAGEGLEEAVED